MSTAKKPNGAETEKIAGRDCYVISSTGELGQNQKNAQCLVSCNRWPDNGVDCFYLLQIPLGTEHKQEYLI